MKRLTKKECEESKKIIEGIKTEVNRALIGQQEVLDGVIKGILCEGHVLVEGVPGIAKTLMIRALGEAMGGKMGRIQFTADLLPTDIIGLTTYTPNKGFHLNKGPVFTNFLLADEINRSPPKTQSALLQSMQEKEVTIGKKTFSLHSPFFVMATQNPLENAGVYPLPEAQVDRFIFKLIMKYPSKESDVEIMGRNMSIHKFEDFNIKRVTSPEKIKKIQDRVKRVYISHELKKYISEITHMSRGGDFEFSEHIEWGASPRGSIAMFIGAKANALMQGRDYVVTQDVKDVVYPVLRHRILLGYAARAQKVNSDKVIKSMLDKIPAP